MAGPGSIPVVTDVNSVPAPQYYNTGTSAYEYLNGANGELYANPVPITPYTTTAAGGYEQGHVIKASAGVLFALQGTMNNTTAPRWIMIFNATSAPGAGTIPIAQVSVVQAISGQGDTNFSLTPSHPYIFSTGIYIASSTTGGVYTASGSADCFYMVDYL